VIREAANRRINLTHHRVVACALRADPALIEEARQVVNDWSMSLGLAQAPGPAHAKHRFGFMVDPPGIERDKG
jgi:hypothetical protein